MPKILRFVLVSVGCLGCLLATAWAVGALYFDLPIAWFRAPLAFIYAAAVMAAFIFVKGRWRAMVVVAFGFVVVLAWWLTLKPTEDRVWQPDVARRAWADVQDDEVTVHNVRNFEYRSETDYTPRWETRSVQPSKLTGVDLAINYWGSPGLHIPLSAFSFPTRCRWPFQSRPAKSLGNVIPLWPVSIGNTN